MRHINVIRRTSLAIALAVGVFGAIAIFSMNATPAIAAGCAAPQYGSIIISGNTASVSVTNPNAGSTCTLNLGLVAYKAFTAWTGSNPQQYLAGQQVFSSRFITLAPHASQTISVSLPSCNYQVDFFQGSYAPVPPDFAAHSDLHLYTWKQTFNLGYCGVTPPSLTCSPSTQTVNVNQAANLSASGGNGTYNWSAFGGSPSSGSGGSFATSYSVSGLRTVTVTSGGQSAQCTVNVQHTIVPPPTCAPAVQDANVGDSVNFTATGGDGTFTWNAPGADITSGSGDVFDTSYSVSGTRFVTVTSAGRTAQCRVNVHTVQTPPPVCSPASQNANVGDSVNFTATGGDGMNYTWNAFDGAPSSGTGPDFSTSYGNSGTKIVTVTSGGRSSQCRVYVQTNTTNLSCTASQSSAMPGAYVNFYATGGNGSYNWNAFSGNPTYGSGSNFTTQFNGIGYQTVTVNSGGQTATCGVTIQQNYYPQYPTCSPSTQNANIGQPVSFYGSGGTGNYSWNAYGGSPVYGYGSNFTTTFNSAGTQIVTLNSNGQSAQCTVYIQQNYSNAPFCSPSTQSASVGQFVNFTASGGNGIFYWNTTADGSPSNGTGTNFGTSFSTPGTKVVTVGSNGQTGQCTVQVGGVLGASTVVTGPEDGAATAAGIGLVGALAASFFLFAKRKKKVAPLAS